MNMAWLEAKHLWDYNKYLPPLHPMSMSTRQRTSGVPGVQAQVAQIVAAGELTGQVQHRWPARGQGSGRVRPPTEVPSW